MPRATVKAHSAVQAPKKLSWARRRLLFTALLTNASAAARNLMRSRGLFMPADNNSQAGRTSVDGAPPRALTVRAWKPAQPHRLLVIELRCSGEELVSKGDLLVGQGVQ